MWDINIFKRVLLVVFPASHHVRHSEFFAILLFNSLMQCLSNVARVQRLLEEHTQMLEEGEGMKFHVSINIHYK